MAVTYRWSVIEVSNQRKERRFGFVFGSRIYIYRRDVYVESGWFSLVLFAVFLYPFGWAFAWQSWQRVIKFDNSLVPPLTTGIIWWHSKRFFEPHSWQMWLSRWKHSNLNVSQNKGRPFDVRSCSIIRSHFLELHSGQQVVNPLFNLDPTIWDPQISQTSKNKSRSLIQNSQVGLPLFQSSILLPFTGILNPK